MFVTDGWPIQYAKETISQYRDHAHIWGINVPGSKYSHAIYTAFFTGQPHTNYMGFPLSGDSLLDSIVDSAVCPSSKIEYVGPKWSLYDVLPEHKDLLFDRVTLFEESLDLPYTHAYPFFFENTNSGLGKFDVSHFLDSLASSGHSLIAHSAFFDHLQHGELKSGLFKDAHFTKLGARTLNRDLISLKDFVDSHPEYLLVLLSDHGVDSFGPDGYRMHGDSEHDNAGFLMLYNPSLSSFHDPALINVVDVCATLSPYLGAAIPINSIGVSHAFPTPSSAQHRQRILTENLNQLVQTSRHRLFSVPDLPADM